MKIVVLFLDTFSNYERKIILNQHTIIAKLSYMQIISSAVSSAMFTLAEAPLRFLLHIVCSGIFQLEHWHGFAFRSMAENAMQHLRHEAHDRDHLLPCTVTSGIKMVRCLWCMKFETWHVKFLRDIYVLVTSMHQRHRRITSSGAHPNKNAHGSCVKNSNGASVCQFWVPELVQCVGYCFRHTEFLRECLIWPPWSWCHKNITCQVSNFMHQIHLTTFIMPLVQGKR